MCGLGSADTLQRLYDGAADVRITVICAARSPITDPRIRPDGSVFERVIELRQNETIDLNENLSQAGTYTWYVYPLGRDFVQVSCLEGGPWTFTKPQSSTPTPTRDASTGTVGGL